MVEITLLINGTSKTLSVEPGEFLVDVLREKLGLTGTKKGCASGDCGACSILMDGRPVTSCLVLAVAADGKTLMTVEGLAPDDRLHPLQQAFIETGAVQCGYCTPGLLVTGKQFLEENPRPTEAQIRAAIAGNLCRCTGYVKIIDAFLLAGERMAKGEA